MTDDEEVLGTAPVSKKKQARLPTPVLRELDIDPDDDTERTVGFVLNGDDEIVVKKAEMSL